MEYRPLGRTGLRVSVLSIGAMTFGDGGVFMKGATSSNDEARRVFDAAIDAGVNLVDTADIYSNGGSEVLTGEWIRGKRDTVLLATKCRFPSGPGPNGGGATRHHIMRSCEASLKRLGTDVIDLYQIHMQDGATPIEETMRALDDLVTAGKVRYVGCSNYTGYRLTEALWASDKRNQVRFESVQLQWSLAMRDCEREMIPASRAFGLGVLVWSPLASGLLSGKYDRTTTPTGTRLALWGDTWKRVATERNFGIIDTLRAIAAERGTTVAAVAIAWLLARPETTSIILGARTVEQLDGNLAALSVTLSQKDRERLDDVSALDWGYPYSMIGRSQPW
jgi:aryl-alcohol dehydrogenase-like predicted oxidoreductase